MAEGAHQFSPTDSNGFPQIFSADGLERLQRARDEFLSAQPYPHLVLDDVFNNEALKRVLEEWPTDKAGKLERHDDGTYVVGKYGSTWETKFGPFTRELLRTLNEPAFLHVLTAATDIWHLVPDPYLFGGGLHFTGVGGRLAVHADFNKHTRYGLDRRLNLLLYLNDGWTEANQGWLELWDREMTGCQRRVLPTMNRMVIFATTRTSYHGQPEPTVGPPDLLRRSLALYYYTNGRPEHEVTEQHSTLWQPRPGQGF